MKYVVNAMEMKRADRLTSEHFGITSDVLMERAALAVAERVEQMKGETTQNFSVCILAGSGGNGGDGVTLARILHLRGYTVRLCLIREKENCGELTKRELEIAEKYGVPMGRELPKEEFSCYVDCLLGIGVLREVVGEYAEWIHEVNGRNGRKLAVDIPSGIHTDTGKVMGVAFRAEETITFGFYKQGLLLYPGASYAGKVKLAEIGITKESFLDEEPKCFCMEAEDLKQGRMDRNPAGNKGSFGKVLVIAGSFCMAGASVLAGKSSLRIGAGMVKLFTEERNREIVQTLLPEAILAVYADTGRKNELHALRERIQQELAWADVCLIGPGLGQSETAKALLEGVGAYLMKEDGIEKKCKRFVLDADAINLLAKDENLFDQFAASPRVVFTPHLMELSRIMKQTIPEITSDFIGNIRLFVSEKKAIFICKDARTGVFYKDRTWINPTGCSALATAGSGDCLAGLIAGLLALGYEPLQASVGGVYIHGLCGEDAGKRLSEASVIASDLVDSIPNVIF